MRERERRVNFSLECEREVQLWIGRVECRERKIGKIREVR